MTIKIIDCTLRDGSHAIGFQFNEELIRKILIGLERGGIRWIELGHGKGLGANSSFGKKSTVSDHENIAIAKDCLKKARFGFFCQKKFTKEIDISEAAKRGVNFLRIGANITDLGQIESLIKFSQNQGLFVFVALMKSYLLLPNAKEFHQTIKKLDQWKVNLISIMDSAGSMTPQQTSQYIIQAKMNTDIPIGFHGHNNLQLAIANTLSAIQSGADAVDASVGGLGRSSGNAPTEILAALFEKYQWNSTIDYKVLSDLSDEVVFPLIMGENRFSSKEITSGLYAFHSSFFPILEEIIKDYDEKIDYRDIICELSQLDRTEININQVKKIVMRALDKKDV